MTDKVMQKGALDDPAGGPFKRPGMKPPSTTGLDEKDADILTVRAAAYDGEPGVRVGDFVRFVGGTLRRVSFIWRDEQGQPESVQTSDGGSYYLGLGYVSMSGSLYTGVPADTLTPTGEVRGGSAWFFHHDYASAHNGVDVVIPFRVFECSREATR